MFKPTTLKVAVEKARMQEKAIDAVQRRHKVQHKSALVVSNPSYAKNSMPNTSRPTAFKLSPEVYEYRKSNRLCFRCGEKYAPSHQCKKQQLNCLIGEVEVEEVGPDIVENPSIPT